MHNFCICKTKWHKKQEIREKSSAVAARKPIGLFTNLLGRCWVQQMDGRQSCESLGSQPVLGILSHPKVFCGRDGAGLKKESPCLRAKGFFGSGCSSSRCLYFHQFVFRNHEFHHAPAEQVGQRGHDEHNHVTGLFAFEAEEQHVGFL